MANWLNDFSHCANTLRKALKFEFDRKSPAICSLLLKFFSQINAFSLIHPIFLGYQCVSLLFCVWIAQQDFRKCYTNLNQLIISRIINFANFPQLSFKLFIEAYCFTLLCKEVIVFAIVRKWFRFFWQDRLLKVAFREGLRFNLKYTVFLLAMFAWLERRYAKFSSVRVGNA